LTNDQVIEHPNRVYYGFGFSTLKNSTLTYHSFTFSTKMIGERMKRDSMVDYNDKIDLKNKLNVGECMIFECRESKFIYHWFKFLKHRQQ
jgi:hypothetical protein